MSPSRPQLVLHAGTHKTGSVALQSFLAAHRDHLQRQGVLYPVLDDDAFSHISLQKHVGLAHTSGNRGPLQHTLNQLQEQIEKSSASCVVLSSEHFFAMPKAWVTTLLAATEPLFGSVSLVIYLRSQRDLWASLFNQHAKALKVLPTHRPWGTADFLGPALVENMFYADYLDAFACHLGANRISARLYDPSQFSGGDVRADFLEKAGLSPPAGGLSTSAAVNLSLGWKGVALALTLAARYRLLESRSIVARGMGKAFQQAHLEGLPDWLGSSPCFLSTEEQRMIRETYTASNVHLANEYASDFDLFAIEPPRPHEERGLSDIDPAELRLVNTFIRDYLATPAAANDESSID
ncbi:MAG: hypothetical protein ACO3NZ_12555 [Pirellulales bacterium]|jgi:hypothetical protein